MAQSARQVQLSVITVCRSGIRGNVNANVCLTTRHHLRTSFLARAVSGEGTGVGGTFRCVASKGMLLARFVLV